MTYEIGKRVIQRLSRERWISPELLMDLCCKCSKKYGGLTRYYLSKFPSEAIHAVGIYRGHAPAVTFDANYHAVLLAVKKRNKSIDDCSVEIKLLSCAIKTIYKRNSIYD